MARVQLSLVICSKNRAAALEKCLRSIRGEEMLAVSGEVILVDNGSSDNTTEVMECFKASSHFPVRVLMESKNGKSNALNLALSVASANVIALTDDDCYLQPGYLKTAALVFTSGRFNYCGGRLLLYDSEDWKYTVNYDQEFSLIPPHSFIEPGKIQGANMVISRDVVDKIGGFDPMLGAGTNFRGEDIDFCARASIAGFWGAYLPSLVIYHHHRRRRGSEESRNLILGDAYGRGAYYAKFILLGKLEYLRRWLKTARSRDIFMRELKGAIYYFLERARNLLHCI